MSNPHCNRCGGDHPDTGNNWVDRDRCLAQLAERVAALEARQAPKPHSRRCSADGASFCFHPDGARCEVCGWPAPAEKAEARTPVCDFCGGSEGPFKQVDAAMSACAKCVTAVEKAEARTCETCGDPITKGTHCTDHGGFSFPASSAPTPCAPAESPHGCVSHDEARRAVNELRSFHGASTGPMPKEFALLDRYRIEREAAERAAGRERADLIAEAEQLRAEVARLRAAGSAGQRRSSKDVPRDPDMCVRWWNGNEPMAPYYLRERLGMPPSGAWNRGEFEILWDPRAAASPDETGGGK